MIDTIFQINDRHIQSERSRAVLKTIILHTSLTYQTYQKGALKATLSIMVIDTSGPNLDVLSPPIVTYAWLHFRSGLVAGYVINGKVSHDELVKLVETNHQHQTMCHAPVRADSPDINISELRHFAC